MIWLLVIIHFKKLVIFAASGKPDPFFSTEKTVSEESQDELEPIISPMSDE